MGAEGGENEQLFLLLWQEEREGEEETALFGLAVDGKERGTVPEDFRSPLLLRWPSGVRRKKGGGRGSRLSLLRKPTGERRVRRARLSSLLIFTRGRRRKEERGGRLPRDLESALKRRRKASLAARSLLSNTPLSMEIRGREKEGRGEKEKRELAGLMNGPSRLCEKKKKRHEAESAVVLLLVFFSTTASGKKEKGKKRREGKIA